MRNMQRKVIVTVVASIALMLVSSQSNAQAGLGCSNDPGSDPPSIATCSIALDCPPVGGVDCTGGVCFCPEGPLAPFCACLVSGTPAGAPLLGRSGLIALVGILCAVGTLGLWRRKGGQRQTA
jgi:hypothetical protein